MGSIVTQQRQQRNRLESGRHGGGSSFSDLYEHPACSSFGTHPCEDASTMTSGGTMRTIDQGKFTATKQTSFDRDESIDVFSVPGPASLIQLALGLTVLVRARY